MKLRMEGFVFIISLLLFGIQISYGSSISCMEVYDQGGVSAVLQSPECSYWFHPLNQSQATNCQFASINGFDNQENDMSCNLDMQIPFTGINGTEYVKVGVVGIFDSIFGREASDMASKLLLDYFVAHTVYLSSKVPLVYSQDKVTGYKNFNGEKSYLNATSHGTGTIHTRILKEALLRTMHDVESTFLKEALEKELLIVGTTATVAVLVDGQILVANIGDSKAFLCSQSINSRNVTEGTLHVKEMTRDHEAAGGGGYVFFGSKKNKHPCVFCIPSGAIGQLICKSSDIIAEPGVTDWQPLTASDTYMILQTRHVTRKLGNPQNVCNLLPHQYSTNPPPPIVECHLESSLAECIVSTAAQKKLKPLTCLPRTSQFMCNLEEEIHQGKGSDFSAVVVPLLSSGFLQHPSA